MSKPVKILELKGDDWLSGLSWQPTLSRGGLFKTMTSFNPFEMEGYLRPALQPEALTDPATSPIKVLTHWSDGATEKVYAHSESKIYEYLRNSPFTQTDKTAQIDITGPSGNTNCAGAIVWKSRYIYSQDTDLRSNVLPVAVASDVQILNGSSTYSDLDYRKLEVGPNKNLYVADGDGVGLLVNSTGTAGNLLPNASNAGTLVIEPGMCVRDLVNDGRYMVVFADGNTRGGTTGKTTNRTTGNYACRIYFWDCSNTAKTTADIIYDIKGDSYIVGAHMLGETIFVFTYNGIYICNWATPPKLIWKFTGNNSNTKRPTNPYAITASHDTIYWGDGATNGQNVYALRRMGDSFVFFSPYQTHGSTYSHISLRYGGDDTLWAGTSQPKLYIHNINATRGNATIQTSVRQLDQAYRLSHVEVTLKTALASGQSVAVSVYDGNDSVIMDTNTKSFTTYGALKMLNFEANPGSTPIHQLDDIYITLTSVLGATINRVCVYAYPIGGIQA